MKKPLFLLLATLLLVSCGGPQTAQIGSATLTYDSSVWESFTNEGTSGIGVKGDVSCWIDLTGDLTQPLPSEMLDQQDMEGVMLYNDPVSGQPSYVSFEVGAETVFARVSTDTPESCVGEILNLAELQ